MFHGITRRENNEKSKMHPLLGSLSFGYVKRHLREEWNDLDYQIRYDLNNPQRDDFNHRDNFYNSQRNYPNYSYCCSDQQVAAY